MFIVKNISFGFNQNHLLFKNLSLQLNPQQIIQIFGVNGSGKTTLFRAILGLEQAKIDHCSIFSNQSLEYLRKSTSYLPSEYHGIFSYYSAYQNLKFFGGFYHQCIDKNLDSVLTKWGFGSGYLSMLKVKYYSSGMKRRLALAKIEFIDNPLWILDEPSTCLDLKGTQLLVDTIKDKLSRNGMVILASHHQFLIDKLEMKKIDLANYK